MRRPSGVKRTTVGYQPAGMNPATRLARGRETSTAATVLLSALATSSVRPSGERPRAFGVVPAGESGTTETEICSVAARATRSSTQTEFVLAHATKRRAPSADRTMAFGCSPTGTSPRGSSVFVS